MCCVRRMAADLAYAAAGPLHRLQVPRAQETLARPVGRLERAFLAHETLARPVAWLERAFLARHAGLAHLRVTRVARRALAAAEPLHRHGVGRASSAR